MSVRRFNRRAQSILEFAAVVAIVVAALMAIRIYAKRAYVGKLRESADRIGDQFSPNDHAYEWVTIANSTTHEKVDDPDGESRTDIIDQRSSRVGYETFAGYNDETFWPQGNAE